MNIREQIETIQIKFISYDELIEREAYFAGKLSLEDLTDSSIKFCQKANQARRNSSWRNFLPN